MTAGARPFSGAATATQEDAAQPTLFPFQWHQSSLVPQPPLPEPLLLLKCALLSPRWFQSIGTIEPMPSSVPQPDEDTLLMLRGIIVAASILVGSCEGDQLSARRHAWLLEAAASHLYRTLKTDMPNHLMVVMLAEAAIFCGRNRLPAPKMSDADEKKLADCQERWASMLCDDKIWSAEWQGHFTPHEVVLHHKLHVFEKAATLIMSGCEPRSLRSAFLLLYVEPRTSEFNWAQLNAICTVLEIAYRLRVSPDDQELLSTCPKLRKQGLFCLRHWQ